jgi:hypothetical protein
VLGAITPYERLHGHKPNLAGVPEWGQHVWVHNLKGSKLDARGLPARWVGYDKESTHAHRIYWPEKHSLSVERDVKFTTNTVTVYTPSTPQTQVQIQPQIPTPKIQPSGTGTTQPTPQAPQPDVDAPDADPIPEMPDEDDPNPAADDDYVIPSPITPPEPAPALPHQPPPAPRKQKPPPPPRTEPPRRSARIAKMSQDGQTTSTQEAPEISLRGHARRVTFSQRGTDSANESFATAPEEPSYAEMAFHAEIEIDTTMAAAAHDANDDPRSVSKA